MDTSIKYKYKSGYYSLIESFLLFEILNVAIFFAQEWYLTFSMVTLILTVLFYLGSKESIVHIFIYDSYLKFYYPVRKKEITIKNDSIVEIFHKDPFTSLRENIVTIKYRNDNKKLISKQLRLSHSSNDEIIVLKHFQSKGIKLKIQSKKVRLLKELGLY